MLRAALTSDPGPQSLAELSGKASHYSKGNICFVPQILQEAVECFSPA